MPEVVDFDIQSANDNGEQSGEESSDEDRSRPRRFRSCAGPSDHLSETNNPQSCITAKRIGQIRGDYGIPMHVELRAPTPDERLDRPQEGWVPFYKLPFTFGFRFPIPELAKEILHHFNLAPAQLMPNAWRTILCILLLGEMGGRQLTLKEFLACYMLKFNPKDRARHYFSYRTDRQLVKELKNVDRGWLYRYFMVSLASLCGCTSSSDIMPIRTTFGVPSEHLHYLLSFSYF